MLWNPRGVVWREEETIGKLNLYNKQVKENISCKSLSSWKYTLKVQGVKKGNPIMNENCSSVAVAIPLALVQLINTKAACNLHSCIFLRPPPVYSKYR